MENEFDYYVVDSKDDDVYPLLTADEGQPIQPFFRQKAIGNMGIVKLKFGAATPKKPLMGDYHYQSGTAGVISNKIYQSLKSMEISTVEFIPVEIRGKNEIYKDYWAIHVINRIACLDRNTAIYTVDEDDENDISIEELKLDKELLSKIPLSERLIFRMKESFSKCLFHKSIVEVIMSINPTGIKFIPADEWKDGVQFEN